MKNKCKCPEINTVIVKTIVNEKPKETDYVGRSFFFKKLLENGWINVECEIKVPFKSNYDCFSVESDENQKGWVVMWIGDRTSNLSEKKTVFARR